MSLSFDPQCPDDLSCLQGPLKALRHLQVVHRLHLESREAELAAHLVSCTGLACPSSVKLEVPSEGVVQAARGHGTPKGHSQ